MTKDTVRVLWLLNHTTLRRFEISQFQALGIKEVFCPKSFPYDEGNLSASVDVSLDANLSIPTEDLQILNHQNWYDTPSEQAWRIANQYFDVAFIGFFPRQIESCIRYFQGSIVLRVFGVPKGYSYTQILGEDLGPTFIEKLRRLGDRFWFGAGYEHLKDEEGSFFKKRNCFLPVGLEGEFNPKLWQGRDKRVFFVCPRIETSPYYKKVYESFKACFSGIEYVIGGAQPIPVNDPNVLGFVPSETHERNMQELRVMFYHNTEPNHIHYHPFEAIRAGMPLVYMAGGMLDRLGSPNMPGRCKTIEEARRKVDRILNDDWTLIDRIRSSQSSLLDPMKPENCAGPWRAGVLRILDSLQRYRLWTRTIPCKYRIAVIVPARYRGGSLRGAKLLAEAIEIGGRQNGWEVEVVLAHLNDPECYPEEEFSDVPLSIKRRSYVWRLLEREEAERAMTYAGLQYGMKAPIYQVPDDGMKQFMDCDLWIMVSDRIEHPILPVRPYVLMVYDYLQRYESVLPQFLNRKFVHAAHAARSVFVTTEFTRQDALQYAGINNQRVVKLPMLAPQFFSSLIATREKGEQRYFLWTTNLARHKNHENAFKALRLYYEKYKGALKCLITGVDTKNILSNDLPHLKQLREIVKESPTLKRQLRILGELPDEAYQAQLAGCEFLWHAGRIDNGTFTVVEAAYFGVPALSSDYPAMREINAQFSLNLTWANAYDPEHMAAQLKRMETEAKILRRNLPSQDRLKTQSIAQLADAYWGAVQQCL